MCVLARMDAGHAHTRQYNTHDFNTGAPEPVHRLPAPPAPPTLPARRPPPLPGTSSMSRGDGSGRLFYAAAPSASDGGEQRRVVPDATPQYLQAIPVRAAQQFPPTHLGGRWLIPFA